VSLLWSLSPNAYTLDPATVPALSTGHTQWALPHRPTHEGELVDSHAGDIQLLYRHRLSCPGFVQYMPVSVRANISVPITIKGGQLKLHAATGHQLMCPSLPHTYTPEEVSWAPHIFYTALHRP